MKLHEMLAVVGTTSGQAGNNWRPRRSTYSLIASCWHVVQLAGRAAVNRLMWVRIPPCQPTKESR